MKIFLISILIAGALLRLDRFGERSFWFDEIAELRHADQFIAEKSLIAGGEGGGRLVTRGYYVFLYLIRLCMGDVNEFTARIPAVFFGILTIFLIYIVTKNLFGVIEGIISSFLLSISTYHIAYSQEARPYSMLAFFSLLTFYFVYKALKQGKVLCWIGFCLSTLLNIYTHYAGFYILGAEIIYIFLWAIINFNSYRKDLAHNILILLCCLFLFSILAWFVILRGLKSIIDLKLLTRHIDGLSFNLGFFYRIFGDFTCLSEPFGYRRFMVIVFGIFLAWGLIRSIKKYRLEMLGLILLIIIPFCMLFTFFKPYRFFNPRYFIFILPIGLICVAHGLRVFVEDINRALKIHSKVVLPILLCFIGLVHIYPLICHHYSQKDDWRGVAGFLNKSAKAGDIILVNLQENTGPLLYYLNENIKKEMPIIGNFRSVPPNSECIWYVMYFRDTFESQEGYKEFRQRFSILDIKRFGEVITLYKLKDVDKIEAGDIGPIRFEAENAPSFIGQKSRDRKAENGFAKVAAVFRDGQGVNLMVYGPWLDLPKGDYIVRFRMRIGNKGVDMVVAKIDINNPSKRELILERDVRTSEFNRAGEYQDFFLVFNHDGEGGLEFRVHFLGKTDLWVDYVEVVG